MALKKSYNKEQFDTKDTSQTVDNPSNGFYTTFLAKDGSGNHDFVIRYTDSSTTYDEKVATESWVNGKSFSTFDGAYSSLTGVPSSFNPSAHNHSASNITSGTFANARISSSNVTQHVGTAALKNGHTETIVLETISGAHTFVFESGVLMNYIRP